MLLLLLFVVSPPPLLTSPFSESKAASLPEAVATTTSLRRLKTLLSRVLSLAIPAARLASDCTIPASDLICDVMRWCMCVSTDASAANASRSTLSCGRFTKSTDSMCASAWVWKGQGRGFRG